MIVESKCTAIGQVVASNNLNPPFLEDELGFGIDKNGGIVVKFKTPSIGMSKYLTVTFSMNNFYTGDALVQARCDLYDMFPSGNLISAAPYQSVQASNIPSVINSLYFKIETNKIKPNTYYYLWFYITGSRGTGYFNPVRSHVIKVGHYAGLSYIDNGSKLEAYSCYIDNGSDWYVYIPYIDNGTGWDIYS